MFKIAQKMSYFFGLKKNLKKDLQKI